MREARAWCLTESERPDISGTGTVRCLVRQVKAESPWTSLAVVYGQELLIREINKVSVCPGAGGSEIEGAIASGSWWCWSQAIHTAEYQGTDAAASEYGVIDGGHYGLEIYSYPIW